MKLEILTKSETSNVQKEIISKIRDLINFKNLEPGDKLPSERMLSVKFGVSRSNVREAIQKLEFYGLLKSIPQSGTFIANIGVIAINGMIDDMIRLDEPDFKSLVETRILLELKTVRLAALRRTDEDLEEIRVAMNAFKEKITNNKTAIEEDLLFHLAIAKASHNSSLNNFMLIITPKIIINFEKNLVCSPEVEGSRIQEHEAIFEAIKDQKPQLAKEKMKEHFKVLYSYCYS